MQLTIYAIEVKRKQKKILRNRNRNGLRQVVFDCQPDLADRDDPNLVVQPVRSSDRRPEEIQFWRKR